MATTLQAGDAIIANINAVSVREMKVVRCQGFFGGVRTDGDTILFLKNDHGELTRYCFPKLLLPVIEIGREPNQYS